MLGVVLAAVISTVHLEGDVTADGGDYVDVPFTVPAGTVEISVAHSDSSDFVILDWGVWGPDGFRGWGGGNTEDAVIGVDASSRSYLPGPITPGTWTVCIGKARLGATGGHYTIDIEFRDAATLPPGTQVTYAPAVLDDTRRWYAGDFHVHSEQSGDATAAFGDIVTLAESRGLDFVNLSDHNTFSQHAQIAALQGDVRDVLFLRGSEITTYSGHANSVGTSGYVDHRLGHDGRTVQGIADDVAAMGGILIVNHPVLDLGTECIGCAWGHVDDTPWDEVAAIELLTGNYDLGVQAFVPRVIELWDRLLDEGHRIAIVGGSDDHRAGGDTGFAASEIGSPTTRVLADNLSEAAIRDAVRAGRTVVALRGPDDPTVEMTIGDAQIGDEVTDAAHVAVRVHVVGGDGMTAQLWRDGAKLAEQAVRGADTSLTFDDEPGAQARRYRIELVDDSARRVVVTSHIYVQGVAASDGCGCATGSPRGGWPIAFVVAWLLLGRARDRRQLAR